MSLAQRRRLRRVSLRLFWNCENMLFHVICYFSRFIVSPHSNNFNRSFIINYLIN